MAPSRFRAWVTAAVVTAATVTTLAADKKVTAEKKSDSYEVLYARYLAAAREMGGRQPATASFDWMAGLAADPRARQVNDLVTVRVVESIVGTGSADSSLDKDSSAHLEVPNLFLVMNKVLTRYDLPKAGEHASETYQVPVAGVLPLSEDMADMGSADIFSLCFPDHAWSRGLQEVAQNIINAK